mgnify:CR=1 FL=1
MINTFGALFRDEKEQEQARMDIIDAMDSNTGAIRNIHGYPMAVINVAAIENTGFAERFLSKIQAEDLWEKCELCNKKSYCHIWNNHRLYWIIKTECMNSFDIIIFGKPNTERV